MALALHLALLGAACLYALKRPDRAWFGVFILGILQDPVRKLTPGTPVAISYSVASLHLVILVASRRQLVAGLKEFRARFPAMNTALTITAIMLLVATLRGLTTFGLSGWAAPLLSLVTYVLPLVLALYGFIWPRREEDIYRLFRFYVVLTSAAMTGTLLEYFNVSLPIIGTVALQGTWIRHLPGIQIRMLSGFYRGPDIMATHAATLACIAAAMAIRSGFRTSAALWGTAAGWGFLNCMIAGRRKAIYFVIVFCAAFLWRSMRRMKGQHIAVFVAVLVILLLIVKQLAGTDETRIYTEGATASQTEIAARLEGGMMNTFREFGFLGAGLGAATQGTGHLVQKQVGWQEGGLGKLAVELGLPGLAAVTVFAALFARIALLLTRIGDVPGCSHFIRVALFALVTANIANFAASAQAYTDAVLGPMAAFLAGCLIATAVIDERSAAPALLKAAPPLTAS